MTGEAKNIPGSFVDGVLYSFRSLGFINRHPRLYPYIIIPFLINVFLFSLAVYFGLSFFDQTVTGYLPQGDAWYWILLKYASWVLAGILTMVLVFFSFTVVGCLIASPFNEILSERTEEILNKTSSNEPFVFSIFLQDMRRTLVDESKKILFFILGMLVLLLLNFLPLIGPLLYGPLSVMWTIFFLTVEYTGYIFARKRLTFRDQRRFILTHKLLMTGFGLGLLCILAIPLFQFLCIPLGVVGATRLYYDIEEKALKESAIP